MESEFLSPLTDRSSALFSFPQLSRFIFHNDKQLLQSFADQAAIAVFNARLYGQVSYEKQRLDALLDSAADGILILNADHTIERCNIAFEHLFGRSRGEIQTKAHAEIIRWARRPEGLTLEEAETNAGH